MFTQVFNWSLMPQTCLDVQMVLIFFFLFWKRTLMKKTNHQMLKKKRMSRWLPSFLSVCPFCWPCLWPWGEYSILAGNGFYIEFEQFSCGGNGQITHYIETELHPPSVVAKKRVLWSQVIFSQKIKTITSHIRQTISQILTRRGRPCW